MPRLRQPAGGARTDRADGGRGRRTRTARPVAVSRCLDPGGGLHGGRDPPEDESLQPVAMAETLTRQARIAWEYARPASRLAFDHTTTGEAQYSKVNTYGGEASVNNTENA